MYTVTVESYSGTETLRAQPGETLRDVLGRAGDFLESPCSGRGICGKCAVSASGGLSAPTEEERSLLGIMRVNDGMRLSCLARVEGDVHVRLKHRTSIWLESSKIDGMPSARRERPGSRQIGVTVDIGTTTLEIWFYDLKTGICLWNESTLNTQRFWGADTISRIEAARNGALRQMHNALMKSINSMIRRFEKKTGESAEDIICSIFAGNTTMLHIAAGLSPEGMAEEPFTPSSTFGFSMPAHATGINTGKQSLVYFMPCFSAFVGADLLAGLLSCGFDLPGGNILYLDVGTNGEMALRKGGKIYLASAPAGPAFEGAEISHGSGAIPGAICSVREEKGRIEYTTIGDEPPIGICGSGLIDICALLLRHGGLSKSGRLTPDQADSLLAGRFDHTDEGLVFTLESEYGIVLTQHDIRQVQLAKSAIAAGADCLLKEAGITYSEVEYLILAGAFGCNISAWNAARIGLFPEELLGRTRAAGNTVGPGEAMILLEEGCGERMELLLESARVIELHDNSFFEERFLERMSF